MNDTKRMCVITNEEVVKRSNLDITALEGVFITYVYTYTHTGSHTYMYIHIYIYTYIHTYCESIMNDTKRMCEEVVKRSNLDIKALEGVYTLTITYDIQVRVFDTF